MDCPEIWSIESHVLCLGAAQFLEHNIQFWHFYCVYGILPPKQPLQCSNQGVLGQDSRTRGWLVSPSTNHGMKKTDPPENK